MAAEDLSKVLRNAGRLVHTPTDLSAAYPHGGTELGPTDGVWCEPHLATVEITAEEFGVEVVEVLEVGESWVIGANLRQWDDDSIAYLFRNTTAGASENVGLFNSSSSNRAGKKASDRAVKLLFAPRSSTGKAAIFYRAVPMIAETARLRMENRVELMIPVMFRCLRDANGFVYEVGTLSDLTVSPT